MKVPDIGKFVNDTLASITPNQYKKEKLEGDKLQQKRIIIPIVVVLIVLIAIVALFAVIYKTKHMTPKDVGMKLLDKVKNMKFQKMPAREEVKNIIPPSFPN